MKNLNNEIFCSLDKMTGTVFSYQVNDEILLRSLGEIK